MARDIHKLIRKRFDEGKPLNINTVLREQPHLIEHAFSGENPLGWRRTLIAADVDPHAIIHRHMDKVKCAICGMESAVLGSHLSLTHNLTSQEYRNQYGNNLEVSSESFRANKFKDTPILGIPHWEQLWSPQYVIDWILALDEVEANLNYTNIATLHKGFASAALHYFGRWDSALTAAGKTPRDIRKSRLPRNWTRQKVIDSIKRLVEIRKTDPTRYVSNDLRNGIRIYFKNAEAAYKAAGVTRDQVSPSANHSSDEIEEVVRLIRSLTPLKGRNRKDRLIRIYNRHKSVVMGHFGSLHKLAIARDIPESVVATETYRHADDVHHDLDELAAEGKPLTFTHIKAKSSILYKTINEQGWAQERMTTMPRKLKFPKCDPRSGKISDRMIMLRRKLLTTQEKAAEMADIPQTIWSDIERGKTTDSKYLENIETLLQEHRIY